MVEKIDEMVAGYESGRVSRRQLVGGLSALVLAAMGVPRVALGDPEEPESTTAETSTTFRSTGLNHIALRVPDVARSRDFYVRHFGLKVLRTGERNSFLGCGGNNFVGLFRSSEAGLDHYCYTVEGYEAGGAVRALEQAGLQPERHEDRVYFEDPDGLTVQVTGEWDDFPGPRP